MPFGKCAITFLVKMYSQNGYTDQPGHVQDLAHSLIIFSCLHLISFTLIIIHHAPDYGSIRCRFFFFRFLFSFQSIRSD
jgi:hypothetical protein